jgi:hypothetical protein
LTLELQQRKIDIVESLKQINLKQINHKARMKNLRDSVDEKYYNEVLELANSVKKKREGSSDMHGSNHL